MEEFLKLLEKSKIKNISDLKTFISENQIKQDYPLYMIILKLIQNLDLSNNLKDSFSFSKKDIRNLEDSCKINPIVVLTPEYGKIMKVGGLAVMIEDLCNELEHLGEKITIILPYYNKDGKNKSNYLQEKGFEFSFKFHVDLHKHTYELGIHHLKERNINFYLMHNFYLFPKIYENSGKKHLMKQMSIFNLGALKLLIHLKIQPSIVLTNDWFAGFASGYNKANYFNDYFKSAKFVHIVHNLGDDYQGRIYLDENENPNDFAYISGLDKNFFIDPFWTDKVINPSRCALMHSDQWATVSKSYRKDIKKTSSLNSLLNKYQNPFAFPNGVRSKVKFENLKKIGTHMQEKIKLLKKYFSIEFIDQRKYSEIILFGFVGRICE